MKSFLFILIFSLALFADKVVLKSGVTVEGDIIGQGRFGEEVERIERALESLRATREDFLLELKAMELTKEQELTIHQFSEQMREDIELFRSDLESRRMLVEQLDIQVLILKICLTKQQF